jgi:hypothetical protein
MELTDLVAAKMSIEHLSSKFVFQQRLAAAQMKSAASIASLIASPLSTKH